MVSRLFSKDRSGVSSRVVYRVAAARPAAVALDGRVVVLRDVAWSTEVVHSSQVYHCADLAVY